MYSSFRFGALGTQWEIATGDPLDDELRQLIRKRISDFERTYSRFRGDSLVAGDIWARTELSPRDRSLITVAALITAGNSEQLPGHLERARQNGLTETELKETIIHLAFYAGWPKAMSAIQVAKHAFES